MIFYKRVRKVAKHKRGYEVKLVICGELRIIKGKACRFESSPI